MGADAELSFGMGTPGSRRAFMWSWAGEWAWGEEAEETIMLGMPVVVPVVLGWCFWCGKGLGVAALDVDSVSVSSHEVRISDTGRAIWLVRTL